MVHQHEAPPTCNRTHRRGAHCFDCVRSKIFVADEIVISIQTRTSADRGRPKPYPAAPGLDASESGGSVSVSIDELGVEGEPLTGHVLLSVRAGLCDGGTKWSGTWSRACTLSQHGVQFCCSCFGIERQNRSPSVPA